MDRETLHALARANQSATLTHDTTHEALVDAIWEAADEGMAQVDIIAAVGLTRERIRQLCAPEYRRRALKRRKKQLTQPVLVTERNPHLFGGERAEGILVVPVSRSAPVPGPHG